MNEHIPQDSAARDDEDEVKVRDAETLELTHHRDPSLRVAAGAARAKAMGRGVEWVRPSELLLSRGGRVAGRGIDFQEELARRARRVPGQTYRATRAGVRVVSERARRLPPVSAFGRGAGERFWWVSRSGIGLG